MSDNAIRNCGNSPIPPASPLRYVCECVCVRRIRYTYIYSIAVTPVAVAATSAAINVQHRNGRRRQLRRLPHDFKGDEDDDDDPFEKLTKPTPD